MTNRRLATLGVLLGIALAGIEGTVVSTAMPSVVASIGGLALYPWVFTSYLLFASVTMPLFGKLSDMYGRKRFFIIGVVVFVLGSVLVGFSQSMPQLIVFRAIQGIGGGAMFTIPYTILGVIYPPEKRGAAIGYGSAVWGIAAFAGPLLGFLIVETLSWRWVFFLPVVVGIAAIGLIIPALDESTGEVTQNIDYSGTVTLTIGIAALLIGLQLFESSSSVFGVTVLLGISGVGLAMFYRVERRASEPIVPLSMFRDTVFTSTNAVAFLGSFVIFGAITFVPLFLQSLRGGAASAALAVFPIPFGWSLTSFLAGRLVTRFGERRLVGFGAAVLVLSFGAATFWTVATPLWLRLLDTFFMGVGTGAVITPALIAVQNHYGDAQMGTVTSLNTLFRNLGGAIGPALLGVVMNLTMREELQSVQGVSNLGDIRQLLLVDAGTAPTELARIMATGLGAVFTVATVVCLLLVGTTFYVPASSLATTDTATPADE